MLSQNTIRGVLLAGVAVFFLVQAMGYPIGTLKRPGPGLFPILLAGLLLAISAAMIVRSFFEAGTPLNFRLRNIALITASLVSFAVVSEFVNMLAGIAVMAAIASYASDDFSVRRTAAIVAVLCVIAVAMKVGLGVQLPLY